MIAVQTEGGGGGSGEIHQQNFSSATPPAFWKEILCRRKGPEENRQLECEVKAAVRWSVDG